MDAYPGGLQHLLYTPPRRAATRVFADSGVSADRRQSARGQPDGLRGAAGTPLPRAETLVCVAVVWTRGDRGDDPVACADGANVRRDGGRRPTIRAHRAVAVFRGVLPVQGERRGE